MLTHEFSNQRELIEGFSNALGSKQDVLLRSRAECDPVMDFAHSVVEGLGSQTPRLDCRFLYDEEGSALFEKICEQPEYYLTRAEDKILGHHGATIRELTGPARLLELGSGNSMKTDHLLSAWLDRGSSAAYVPVDVSVSALRKAGQSIADVHDGVRFVGINATYEEVMPVMGRASPVMMMFMGSTVGNLHDNEAARFFGQVSQALNPGDFFLVGIDLVKDRGIIEAAYNDQAGFTAQFTLNMFERMNRQLRSSIDVSSLTHEAEYNEVKEQIETHVRFQKSQEIDIIPLGRTITIEAGTRILVEISRKFRLEKVVEDLRQFQLEKVADFTDEEGQFGLLLLKRTSKNYGY